MRRVTVDWESDGDRFTARGTHAAHAIPIDAPHEGSPTGFSATELLLAGAGSCSAWDLVEILRKQRQDVSAVRVEVTGEQATDPPWPYERITLRYTVSGRALDPASVERAVALSVEGYCSVLATVRGVAKVATELELVQDAQHAGTQNQEDAPFEQRP